jgi:hypothetical protein
MLPQIAARQLLDSLRAPAGAVTVWPWHEDDGTVTMLVVINPKAFVDERDIPKLYQGFAVRVEHRDAPLVT